MEDVLPRPGPNDITALGPRSPVTRKRKRGRHAVACEACHRRKQRVSDARIVLTLGRAKVYVSEAGTPSTVYVPFRPQPPLVSRLLKF
jgi:hypothetical protein